ncbi:MAG: hypothetical protein AB9903_34265 [Vulcanimicrobiota bacterium]
MARKIKPGGTGQGLPLVGVRLEPDILQWLDEQVELNDTSRAEYIRTLLTNEFFRLKTYGFRLKNQYAQDVTISGYIALYQRHIKELRDKISSLEAQENEARMNLITTERANNGNNETDKEIAFWHNLVTYYEKTIQSIQKDILFLKKEIEHLMYTGGELSIEVIQSDRRG